MKKLLLLVMFGASLLYGEQVTYTNTTVEAEQIELEQIKKEIEQLKSEQAESMELSLDQSVENVNDNYTIQGEVHQFLNEFYMASESNNMKATLGFYDDYVIEYFSKGIVTREDIYKDKLSNNNKWEDRSYKLKNYKIVSDASGAGIHYINVEVEVEWELSSNDKKLNGKSVDLFQLMELDGKLSIVSITETNQV